MEPEVYFIKYAYPCAHILCTVRGDVSEEKFKEMEQAAIHNRGDGQGVFGEGFF